MMEKGTRFGCLIVLEPPFVKRMPNRKMYLVKCRCDCGKETIVQRYRLLNGHTKSCGHLRSVAMANATRKHGFANAIPEYGIWKAMRRRCNDPKNKFYFRYGGRGIKICEEWNDFAVFLADMGRRPSTSHSLERINNDENYCSANCKWATQKEQSNNRSSCVLLSFAGETFNIQQWSERLNFSSGLIFDRLKRGWPVDRILTEPVHLSKRRVR